MQLADTQIGMRESFSGQPAGWDEEKRLFRKAVDEINRLQPTFAIVCGDMVDQAPDGKQLDKRPKQINDFKEVWSRCQVPLVCVCGNHDVGNRPTPTSVAQYQRDFGNDHFVFWVHNTKCLVLNSQYWKDDTDVKQLREVQDKWLEMELSKADTLQAQHVLAFVHIPPFIRKAEEPNGYFNLDKSVRQWLLSLLASHGVRTVFCGHYHRNAGGWYPSEEKRKLEVVVTGACGVNVGSNANGNELEISGMGNIDIGDDVSGVRLVSVSEQCIDHEWYSFTALSRVEPPILTKSQNGSSGNWSTFSMKRKRDTGNDKSRID